MDGRMQVTRREFGRLAAGAAGALALAQLPATALAETQTGTFGDGCTWELSDAGTLTIRPTDGTSGTMIAFVAGGETTEFDHSLVKSLVIEPGVKAPVDSSWLFAGLRNMTSACLSNLDTSGVTSMDQMFYGCPSLTSLDLSAWNTSSVTSMRLMFSAGGYEHNSLASLDLSGWDTSNVTDMTGMFDRCSLLTTLDLSGFDTSSVTNMGEMFYGCSSLTSLNASRFNTSQVTDMERMFYGCSSLASLDLSGWDTSQAINMEQMFEGCYSLASLDLSGWDTSGVTDMQQMLLDCYRLRELTLGPTFRFVEVEEDAYDWMEPHAYLPQGTWSHGGLSLAADDLMSSYDGSGAMTGTWTRTLFSDVDASTSHEDDVLWLAGRGISTGFPDGTFRPYDNVARCDMAAFLYRLRGTLRRRTSEFDPATATRSFSDVDASTPHYAEILWLAEEGISTGWDNGDGTAEFRPLATVARCDMAAFLYRLEEGLYHFSFDPTEATRSFTDVDETTAHYKEILWLAQVGVSTGWDNGDGTASFRPLATVARCDMAAFMHRIANLTWGKG